MFNDKEIEIWVKGTKTGEDLETKNTLKNQIVQQVNKYIRDKNIFS